MHKVRSVGEKIRLAQYFSEDLHANSRSKGVLKGCIAFFLNPGFMALVIYRLSSRFQNMGGAGRLLAIFFWRLNVSMTGCYFHPGSLIGPGLCLPHPTGIVVGANVKIGSHVTLYQNVTLGTNNSASFEYPTICDESVIYAGAVVIGASVIGRSAIVGANAVVNLDVPEGGIAVGVPARVLTSRAMRS